MYIPRVGLTMAVGLAVIAVLAAWAALAKDAGAGTGGVNEVDPATLTCGGNITFDDVAGGPAPGTNYDAVFESDGADFAERFAGQTLSFSGDSDVLSGAPTNPLTLQVGDPNDNLNVFDNGGAGAQVLTGLGPLGFPNASAIGEGAFAVLFDFDQSEFGFDIVGGDGGAGTATVQFFARNGTLIDTIVLSALSDQSYGFARAGGVQDIAGISVHNDDGGGIGFDNLCHDVPGVVGQPTPTPSPTPTPIPTPSPEATPTPTPIAAAPAALPDTGGEPGDSSAAWLVALIGTAVLAGGGAGWLALAGRRAR